MDKNLTIDERKALKPGERVWWQAYDDLPPHLGTVAAVGDDGLLYVGDAMQLPPECRVWRADADAKPCKDCAELRAKLALTEASYLACAEQRASAERQRDEARAELERVKAHHAALQADYAKVNAQFAELAARKTKPLSDNDLLVNVASCLLLADYGEQARAKLARWRKAMEKGEG